MPNRLDLLYVVVLVVAFPLYSHFVSWPRLQRRLRDFPDRARLRSYVSTMAEQWTLVAIVATLWRFYGRPAPALGLVPPAGWRLGVAIGFAALLLAHQVYTIRVVSRSPRARAKVRAQIGLFDAFIPRTPFQVAVTVPLALTAGFCEELLFRGYLLWVMAPWLTWWGGAAVAIVAFGLLHAYQGKKGIVRTGLVGLLMTIFVAATRSLYPAMFVHALVDVGGLVTCWIALRKEDPEADGVTEPKREPAGTPGASAAVAST